MAEHDEQAGVDQPEPDRVIADRPLVTPDHPPTDQDDRRVELDEPDRTTPPIDDEDRATGR